MIVALKFRYQKLTKGIVIMKFGTLLMPSHPPERTIREGQRWDLDELERLDALGFEEAWVGEHFTAPEPRPPTC
jgi:alkanesulfonate monooxygenase SsuD/methylene tetrahydromethanopterin reductase-like flavin-dependent oxidoreductase (luciferase family)